MVFRAPRLGASARSSSFNQSATLLPAGADKGSEFGASLGISQLSDADSSSSTHTSAAARTLLLVGAAGHAKRGAVFSVGPFDSASPNHAGLADAPPLLRLLAPYTLGASARFGQSLAVDPSSGLALIGAPGSWTSHGAASGAVLRSWILRTPLPASEGAASGNSSSGGGGSVSGSSGRDAPPVLAHSTLLASISEQLIWGEDSDPGDSFGHSISLSKDGYALCGAPLNRGRAAASSEDASRSDEVSADAAGAAYIYLPTSTSPSLPPPPAHPAPNISMPSPPTAPTQHQPGGTAFLVAAGAFAISLIVILLIAMAACIRYRNSASARVIPYAKARWRVALRAVKRSGGVRTVWLEPQRPTAAELQMALADRAHWWSAKLEQTHLGDDGLMRVEEVEEMAGGATSAMSPMPNGARGGGRISPREMAMAGGARCRCAVRPQSRGTEQTSPVYAGLAKSSVLAAARAAVAAAPPQRIDPPLPPGNPPPARHGAWGAAAVAACRQQDLNRQLQVRRQLLELQRQLEAKQKELGAMHDAAPAAGPSAGDRPDPDGSAEVPLAPAEEGWTGVQPL